MSDSIFSTPKSKYQLLLTVLPLLTIGFVYGFAVYSEALKTKYGLSGGEIASIGSAMTAIGQYGVQTGFGLLLPIVGIKYGFLGAAIMCTFGYLGHFLLYTEAIAFNFQFLWFSSFLVGGGVASGILALLAVTVTHTSPKIRAVTVAYVLTVYALSPIVVSYIFRHFLVEYEYLFALLATLGAVSFTLCFFFYAPVAPATEKPAITADSDEAELINEEEASTPAASTTAVVAETDDRSLLRCMASPQFICTWLFAFATISVSLSLIGNAASINKAFLYSEGETDNIQATNDFAVYLISGGNLSGRLVFGSLIDLTGNKLNIGRGGWIFLDAILLAVFSFWVAGAESLTSLLTAEFFVAFAHGGLFTCLGTFVSETFPMKHYTALFGLTILGPCFGGMTGNKIFGYFYDQLSHPATNEPNSPSICPDTECYAPAFRVSGFLALCIAVPAAAVVFYFDQKRRKLAAAKAQKVAIQDAVEDENAPVIADRE